MDDELRLAPGPDLTASYRCEANAHTHTQIIWLGSHQAATPRLAIRWLHSRAHQLADQLDPPDAHVVRLWLHHEPEHERALSLLRFGEPYTFSFHDENAHYVLTVEPDQGQEPGQERSRDQEQVHCQEHGDQEQPETPPPV